MAMKKSVGSGATTTTTTMTTASIFTKAGPPSATSTTTAATATITTVDSKSSQPAASANFVPQPTIDEMKVSLPTTPQTAKPTSAMHEDPTMSAVPSLSPRPRPQQADNYKQRQRQPRRSMSSPDLRSSSTASLVQRFLQLGSSSSGSNSNNIGSNDSGTATLTGPPAPTDSSSAEIMTITNEEVRAQYNARIMPEKVVLVRHGQSMGNIDETMYARVPDNAMPLTDLGWEQAKKAGEVLKERIIASGETVHFIVSPYVRTVETFHGMVSAWCDPKEFSHIKDRDKRVKAWYRKLMDMGLTWNEDPRIREQDFGNYQVPEIIKRAKTERHAFGVFYYRFQNGESASDVFDRVSTFLDSLWRNFESNRSRNYVLVTHGISIRVFLARYFRYTIDQFNVLANPKNCEMVVLGHNGEGHLGMKGRCQLELEVSDDGTKQTRVVGHKFHRRLRILPKAAIRRSKIRISPDD